ncbi:MAG: ribosome silencing factor, partial [Candidatus Kapabacteria bacterium]|nr:ribosome silencing factor [Candidatus Kapabacteria bacterium]MDW8225853.1 ribosome silencing factor [Bacteroidota bacterium]
ATDAHMRAVAESIEEATRRRGIAPPRREGWDASQWILLDYFGVVVHLFQPNARAYYRLERLWGDVPWLRLSERTRRLYSMKTSVAERSDNVARTLS